jgi:hypothetical protein
MLSRDAMRVVREAFRDRRHVTRDELLARANTASLQDEQLAMFAALPEGRLDEIDVLGALVAADHKRVGTGG